MANKVMANLGEHQIKILDDIGIGWGARNWQDQDNKAKNDVVQISRVSEQIVIYSTPSQFLLDKIPRSLVSHYGETHQQFFRLGYTTIKVFEPQILHRQGKIIQPYLIVNKNKFVMYQIFAPPKELALEYDRIRREVTMRISQERMDQIMGNSVGEKLTTTQKKLQDDMNVYGDRILSMEKQGDSMYQMTKSLGISKDKIARIRAHLLMPT
jgi:hypothetical protein